MNFSKELIEQHKENAVTIQVVYQELLKSLHKSTGVVDAGTAEALHSVAVQLTKATTGKKDINALVEAITLFAFLVPVKPVEPVTPTEEIGLKPQDGSQITIPFDFEGTNGI